MTKLRALAALLFAAALSSCEDNAVQQIAGPATGARIRFLHYGVGAPGVNFYANDVKMTATNTADTVESTIGTNYGSAAAGGRYAAIAPGQLTLSGRISATTDKDRPISNLAATLADGKFYSFYQSGFYDATAKTVDAFIVEDNFAVERDYSVAYVRFVNAIGNSTPLTLYAKHTETQTEVPIGGAVAYKEAGQFTAIPRGVYDLAARTTGSATNAVVSTGVSFSPGHVYTIGARGDITVTSTTAEARPTLSNVANW